MGGARHSEQSGKEITDLGKDLGLDKVPIGVKPELGDKSGHLGLNGLY